MRVLVLDTRIVWKSIWSGDQVEAAFQVKYTCYEEVYTVVFLVSVLYKAEVHFMWLKEFYKNDILFNEVLKEVTTDWSSGSSLYPCSSNKPEFTTL